MAERAEQEARAKAAAEAARAKEAAERAEQEARAKAAAEPMRNEVVAPAGGARGSGCRTAIPEDIQKVLQHRGHALLIGASRLYLRLGQAGERQR